MNASLKGEITIDTTSIGEAETKIEELGQKLGELNKNAKSIDIVAQAFKEITKQSKAQTKAVQDSTKASNDSAAAQERIANLVSRASSRMADFEQAVRKSNASQFEQVAVATKAQSALKLYQQNLETAGHSGLALDTANTQLSTSMAELKRQIKDVGTSGASQRKAIDNLSISYEKMVRDVNNSSMAEEKKATILAKLKKEYTETNKILKTNNASTTEAAQAQGTFKKAMGEASTEVKRAGQEMKKAQVANFNKQMSDMSSSVQLALGPLSGVASRVTALGALFKRNAASIAALTASFTGFSVALMKTISVGREAERQTLALNGQVETLGLGAFTSGKRLNQMARDIASSTLTSAQAVRESQSALLEFRNIGVNSFEGVLLTAQGLSQTFGGSLADSTKRLGRLLNDPISNFDALSRQGITFNEVERERLRTLVQTGKLQQAQNEIMERFTALQERAKNETGGLSGQMDTLGDNVAMAAEKLFEMGGTGAGATRAVKSLSDAIAQFADSEAAVTLANAFGTAVRGVATSIEFMVRNARIIGAVLAGVVVSGIAKATLALGSYILNTKIATIAKLGFTRSIAANIVAMKGYLAATNLATLATRALGMALRFVVPVIGIAVTALEVFGVINLFSPSQKSQLDNMQREISETTNRARELIDVLEADNRINIDTSTLQSGQRIVSHFENELIKAVKAKENLEKPVRGGESWDVYRARLRQFNHQMQEAEARIERASSGLRDSERYLKGQIKATENAAQAQENNVRAQEEYTASLESAIKASRAITDSEGSRIDSMKEQIQGIETLIADEKALTEGNKKLVQQLERERDLLIERKKQMQLNSRENREADRSKLRLVRIEADYEEQLRRVEIFQKNNTEASIEAALAASAQEKQLARNVERVSTLREEEQLALASTLRLSEAYIEARNSAGGAAAGAKVLAQGLAEQSRAAINAEEAAKRLTAAQQVAQSLQEKFDPMAGLQREVRDDAAAILQGGLSEEDQAEALANLDRYFQAEKEAIERGRAWVLEDTLSFKPLGEVEQFERDLQTRLATLSEYFDKESDEYAAHVSALNAEADKQRMFIKVGENAQKGADIFEGAMDAMQSASQENTRAYKIIAMAQATMAGAAAITKAYNEGGLLLGGVMAAKVGAQVGAIAATGFNDGGFVSGKGSGRSDSIAANLSNGEFVLRKRAVDSLGVGFLKRLNDDGASAFNMGGMVGGAAVISNNVQRSGGVNLQIINNGNPLEVERTEMTEGEDGEVFLKAFVRQATQDLHEEGTLDGTMATSYGLNRKPRRR